MIPRANRFLLFGGLVACGLVLAVLWIRSSVDRSRDGSSSTVESELEPPVDASEGLERQNESATNRGLAPADSPETNRLVVEVLSDADHPVSGVHVLLFDEKTLLGNATSDTEGRCSFQATEGSGGLLAWRDGRAPIRQPTSLAAGHTTIRLAAGARVAGTARRPDGGPASKVPLLLTSDQPFFDAKDLPPSVLEALPDTLRAGGRAEGITDADGRFGFEGLVPAWKGALYVERAHWLIEASQGSLRHNGGVWPFESGVLLEAPVDGLVLSILDLPVISGRIVTADGSAGVPGALVDAFVRVEGSGPYPPSTGSHADADGRFRIALDPVNHLETEAWLERHEVAGVIGVVVDASSRESTGRVRREFPLENPRGPWNLGDIPLARTRALDFVVRNPSGEPIAGAVGRAQSAKLSKPTDAAGRGHAEGVPEDASEWIVGARGYAVTRVPIPRDPSETLQVVLTTSNELVVHVRAEQGPLLEGVVVEIAGDAPFFGRGPEKDDWRPDKVQTATGDSEFQSSTSGPSGGATRFPPDAEGRVLLHGFVPARPFTIRVQGSAGTMLHEEAALGLGREEKRTVEIVLPAAGRNLSGRVVDADGKPIVGANVSLFAGDSGTGVSSGSLGEFRIEGLAGGTFELSVSKPGYATRFEPEYELQASAEPVEFRLEPGHQVRVRVVDAAGAPVKDCSAGISDARGGYAHGRHVDAGVFEFPDLPAKTLRFFASVGGVHYPKEHSALEPELTITVPLQGAIEIRLPQSMEIDPKWSVRLVLDPGQGGASGSALEIDPTETHATLLRFGAVLPGEYGGRLEQWSISEGAPKGEWKPIGRPRAIAVRAGETSALDWEP